MNLRSRQAKGIIGMAMAVLGAVAWFTDARIAAFVLWGGAAFIMLSLNRRKAPKR
jgi:hypothetical protein